MTAAAPTLAAPPPAARAIRPPPPGVVAAAVIVVAVAARIATGWGTPLWFDETFSAVIASQPSAAALVDWCRAEIGGPVYYMLLWGWAQLFGTSAVALRSLSFLASVAAPALIAWRGHPDRGTRLLWAALLALWLPGFDPATNARCYALAVLATTLQAIAYRRLIAAPDRARALAWTGASAAAVLIHLHSAAIAVVGGLIFVAVHRRRALACWPALAPLVPVAMWFALQWPVLARFGGQGNWYQPFGWGNVLVAPEELFESFLLGVLLTAGPILSALRGWRGAAPAAAADRAVAASGLLGLGAVLLLAAIKPSFAWRYAIPFGPPILFAVAIWAQGLRPHVRAAPAIVLMLFWSSAVGRVIGLATQPSADYRTNFNFVLPSAWLAARGARHLAFLWDSPTGTMSDPRRIAEVSGYFLRQRYPIRVTVLRAPAPTPPATLVTDALGRDPSIDSLIWIADRFVPGTRALPDRRPLARRGWVCRDFARDPIHLLTCRAPAR